MSAVLVPCPTCERLVPQDDLVEGWGPCSQCRAEADALVEQETEVWLGKGKETS